MLLAFGSLTFTPADFDGFKVAVPASSGPPIEEKGIKTWNGIVDAPLEAGHKSKSGPWPNPYFRVRITDLAALNGKPNEQRALEDRLKNWSHDGFIQVMQRITLAKLGDMHLLVLNGSAVQATRKGSLPIYFVDTCFSYNKKLYEYRFASTRSDDVEKAIKALDVVSLTADGAEEIAKDLPSGVSGKYSVGRQIVVETPIVPFPSSRSSVVGGDQWVGVIGDPTDGGFYLTISEIGQAPSGRSAQHGAKPAVQFPPKGNVNSDEQIARYLLQLLPFEGSIVDPELRRGLRVTNLHDLNGTKAALYLASTPESGVVLSAQYRRSSEWTGILACRGDRKLSDGEVRLGIVELGTLLAPGLP